MTEAGKMQNSEQVDGTVESRMELEAVVEDRKGNFANFFIASNAGNIVLLDCFLIDAVGATEDGGEIRHGMLTSRVVTDRDSFIQLRDMMSNHISANGWE